jgi:hypothetical protein
MTYARMTRFVVDIDVRKVIRMLLGENLRRVRRRLTDCGRQRRLARRVRADLLQRQLAKTPARHTDRK